MGKIIIYSLLIMSCKDVFVLWCYLCLLNINFFGLCYKDNYEIKCLNRFYLKKYIR